MRTEIATLTASILINAGALLSLEHSTLLSDKAWIATHQKETLKKGGEAMDFEFVEAPAAPVARTPLDNRRISSHNAVSQDLSGQKSALPQDAPKVERHGRSDQLGQTEGKPGSLPREATPELPAKPLIPPAPVKDVGDALGKTEDAFAPPSMPSPRLIPQPATPLRQGSGGRDRITTQEISRSRSHGAQLYGVTSFEATGSGMGVYMKNLKERIWLAWFPYLVAHYPKDFKTADAVISFTLNAQGEVKIVRLADSQGSPLFAAFCMESVQRAGPFGPVPPEVLELIGKEELEIKFAFHYW